MKNCIWLLLTLLLAGPAAAALVPYPGHNGQGVTDNLGFRWDIHPNGMLADGTNDLFDGGLQLHVNNQPFQGQQWMLDDVTREIVCGPMPLGNVQVTRRILIDTEHGVGRWLEVFENQTAQAVSVQATIYSDLGGGCQATERYQNGRIGWLTVTQQAPRPVIGMAMFDPSLRREVEMAAQPGTGQLQIFYRNISIPANGMVVICHFLVQRHDAAAAREAVAKLRLAQQLRTIEPRLRRALYNFRRSGDEESGLRVERRPGTDLLTTDADELLGTLTLSSVRVPTALGTFTVAGRDIIAIQPAPDGEQGLEVVTHEGEVLRTKPGQTLSGRAAACLLDSGLRLSVPVEQIRTFARRSGSTAPALRTRYPRVVLTSGDQLVIDPQFPRVKLQTPYGTPEVPLAQLASVQLHDGRSEQPSVCLRDGSRFEGFLQADRLPVKLRGGRLRQLPVETVVALQCRAESEVPLTEPYALMENGDVLRGLPADTGLRVATTFGRLTVPGAQIATITAVPDAPLTVALGMVDGSRLQARLTGDLLAFTLTGGQRLLLAPGHLREARLRPVNVPEEPVAEETEEEAEEAENPPVAVAAPDTTAMARALQLYELFDSRVYGARLSPEAEFVSERGGMVLRIPRGERLTFRVPSSFLNAATVMCRVQVDTGSGRVMFWRHDAAYPSAFYYPDHAYRLGMHFLAGQQDIHAVLASRMEPGRWYHLTQSWGPDGFRAYVDGRLAFQDVRQRTGVTRNTHPAGRVVQPRLHLGSAEEASAELGGALYDDFAVFSRQLSDAEVALLAHEPQQLRRLGEVRETWRRSAAAVTAPRPDTGGNR